MMKPFEISANETSFGRKPTRADMSPRRHRRPARRSCRRDVASSRRASSSRRPVRVRLRPLHTRSSRSSRSRRRSGAPRQHLAGVHVRPPSRTPCGRYRWIIRFPSGSRGVPSPRRRSRRCARRPGRHIAAVTLGIREAMIANGFGDSVRAVARYVSVGLRQGAHRGSDRRRGAGRRGRGPGAVRGGQTPRRRCSSRWHGQAFGRDAASIRDTSRTRDARCSCSTCRFPRRDVDGAGAAGSDDARAAGERPGGSVTGTGSVRGGLVRARTRRPIGCARCPRGGGRVLQGGEHAAGPGRGREARAARLRRGRRRRLGWCWWTIFTWIFTRGRFSSRCV